jgi:squalene-hopene/tetraprenyl-beta-curcumene cyclase
VRPGGWAFQYTNPHYPDLDDTAAVVLAMDRLVRGPRPVHDADLHRAIARGREWVVGMQSANGGFGAFDADHASEYLNHLPFADHGALIDPPTADVTARCVGMLAQLRNPADASALRAGLTFLRRGQERDGSWYGRWGMNYIYGTWSALCALNAAGADLQGSDVRRAVGWLVSIQNPDGGWGERGESYELDYRGHEPASSMPSQTAWALLGLMAAGDVDHPAVARGVDYLVRTQDGDGSWAEDRFNATGFPRVFYLRYHGYSRYFPLWALARYQHLRLTGERRVRYGM